MTTVPIPHEWRTPPTFQWGEVEQALAVHAIVEAAGESLRKDLEGKTLKYLAAFGDSANLEGLKLRKIAFEQGAVKLTYGNNHGRVATYFVAEDVFKDYFNQECAGAFRDFYYLRLGDA